MVELEALRREKKNALSRMCAYSSEEDSAPSMVQEVHCKQPAVMGLSRFPREWGLVLVSFADGVDS